MFKNKTIVVTGGSSGIGKKITEEILAEREGYSFYQKTKKNKFS